MSKTALYIIIGLMSISLLFIGLSQYSFFKDGLRIIERRFEQDVNEAMLNITQKLEKQEAKIMFTQKIKITDENEQLVQEIDTNFFHWDSMQVIIDDHGKRENEFRTEVIVINDDSLHSNIKHENLIVIKEEDAVRKEQLKKYQIKLTQLSEVMENMAMDFVTEKIPLEKRMASIPVDSLISAELEAAGLKQDYVYAVLSNDSAIKGLSSPNYKAEDLAAYYQTPLFPSDLSGSDAALAIAFPNKRVFMRYDFWRMFAWSILFSLIIVLTFGLTIYYLIKQKRIADIKTDFINNMTHELKTPISTISLAIDALEHPDSKQKAEPSYYTGIIREENSRMDKQLENILQMALMEKRDFQLRFQEIELHKLIRSIASQVELTIESRKGELDLQLNAKYTNITGDEIHLGNSIRNLLDNAIKYSVGAPQIVIKTADAEMGISVSVKDNGIGMKPETQKKIFGKFYRATGGDLHDTKGFGLGLSYVKAIIEAHHGQLQVHSQLRQGTTMTILIPHDIKSHV